MGNVESPVESPVECNGIMETKLYRDLHTQRKITRALNRDDDETEERRESKSNDELKWKVTIDELFILDTEYVCPNNRQRRRSHYQPEREEEKYEYDKIRYDSIRFDSNCRLLWDTMLDKIFCTPGE